MIDIYKMDHLLWRWRVYNMLLGNDKVDINEVLGITKNVDLESGIMEHNVISLGIKKYL